MCVKRALAREVKFKDKSFAEDADYAKRLKKHLRTQAKIEKTLYYYDFSHSISEAQ